MYSGRCVLLLIAVLMLVQAAARGLDEELGIGCRPADLQGPMAPNHARKLEVPGQFCDCEFVECYRYVLSEFEASHMRCQIDVLDKGCKILLMQAGCI